MEEKKNKQAGWGFITGCGLLCIAICILQLVAPLALNLSVLYTAVVLLTIFIPGMRYTLVFAFLATLLIASVFIYHLPEIDKANLLSTVLINRAFALIGVWIAFYVIRDVKKAHEKTSRSTERLDALFKNATEGIVVSGGKGEIINVNPEAEKQFGYTRDELIGKRIEILIPERFSGKHVEHRKDYYQKPHSRYMGAGMDLYARRKDASEFPVEISLSTFSTSEGMFVVSFIIDITARKQQEEALKQEKELALRSTERLDALFKHATEGIIISNKSGEIVQVNPEAEKQFGYTMHDLNGQRIEALIPNRFLGKHGGHRNSYYQNPRTRYMGAGMELFAKRKDGSEFPVEISLSAFDTSEGQFVVSFIIDITQRKRQEEALRKEKETAQLYLEVAPVIFIAVTKEGMVSLVNSAGCRIFGYSEKEMLGKDWLKDLVPQDAQPLSEKILTEIYEKKDLSVKEYENHIITRAGQKRIILWKITALKGETGDIIATLRSGEDITERKTQEEAIKKAHEDLKDFSLRLQESNAELEQFAYISSHDLQEPLRKIQSFGDRLKQKEGPQLSEQGKDYIDRMLNAASRMQNLINDLLAFSRVTSKAKPFEKTDLNYVLKGVLSDLEITIEKAHAKIEVLSQLPIIDADPTQMRQVFQNLISNAIKFRKDNEAPIIKIQNRNIYSTEKGQENKQLVEISVEDNGIGFDEKYTDRIFNIFQRLEGQKYEGSGIGLAICKKIALRHGGDINAKSLPGKGSTFIIKLAIHHEQ